MPSNFLTPGYPSAANLALQQQQQQAAVIEETELEVTNEDHYKDGSSLLLMEHLKTTGIGHCLQLSQLFRSYCSLCAQHFSRSKIFPG